MKKEINLNILKATFDDLPVGLGIFHVADLNDLKSISYVFMNKVILHEMRMTKEQVLGKKIFDVAPEAFEHASGIQIIETYRHIAKNGGSINLGLVEYSNHLVAGTYDCSVHHIQDSYVYIMLRNVTELEQTKNELEDKNRELSEFAFMVSHDLKEPLRTIHSFTSILSKKYQNQLDEKGKKLIDFILSGSIRMRKLIDELLTYSKLKEEKEMELVDCNTLIEIIQKDLKLKIKETKTKFFIEKLPTIKGHKTQLRLLFQNLISNAIKFSKKDTKPQIKIFAKQEKDWIFAIEDNGIGIEKEHFQKIFHVFQRLHSNDRYDGTGIGLAHCKKIIALHKGNIWVDATPNKGSVFYFSIPNNE